MKADPVFNVDDMRQFVRVFIKYRLKSENIASFHLQVCYKNSSLGTYWQPQWTELYL